MTTTPAAASAAAATSFGTSIQGRDKEQRWCVRQTATEMLHDRGYTIVPTCLFDKEPFFMLMDNQEDTRNIYYLLGYREVSPDVYENIFVRFHHDTKQITKTEYAATVDYANHITHESGVPQPDAELRIIIVSRSAINPTLKRELEGNPLVQVFNETEMLINITRHEFQPSFRLIHDTTHKEEILNTYGVEQRHLMVITEDDPVSKYYGATHDDIFMITRISPTQGQTVALRTVRGRRG